MKPFLKRPLNIYINHIKNITPIFILILANLSAYIFFGDAVKSFIISCFIISFALVLFKTHKITSIIAFSLGILLLFFGYQIANFLNQIGYDSLIEVWHADYNESKFWLSSLITQEFSSIIIHKKKIVFLLL